MWQLKGNLQLWPMRVRPFDLFGLLFGLLIVGCSQPETADGCGSKACLPVYKGMKGALIATRFQSLEEFSQLVHIDYEGDTTMPDTLPGHAVTLCHCTDGWKVTSRLESGPSQDDLMRAKDGNFLQKAALLVSAPDVLAHRADLERVFLLSRHLQSRFGEGDPAFFDLADTARSHMPHSEIIAFSPKDAGEKGFINTFNHIIAQAFITALFSEELADLAADLHERKNMPQLCTGRFSKNQIQDPDNNPVDNYVDMINNEWGQELGKMLAAKYGIHRGTAWSSGLMCNFLNDLQSFFMWSTGVSMRPFTEQDDLMWRFSAKINLVMKP
jgi:hypothetical protein